VQRGFFDLRERRLREPHFSPTLGFGSASRARLDEPQSDPELEALRMRYHWWMRRVWVVTLAGVAIPVALALLGGWLMTMR
jgi:hypothetical protein